MTNAEDGDGSKSAEDSAALVRVKKLVRVRLSLNLDRCRRVVWVDGVVRETKADVEPAKRMTAALIVFIMLKFGWYGDERCFVFTG